MPLSAKTAPVKTDAPAKPAETREQAAARFYDGAGARKQPPVVSRRLSDGALKTDDRKPTTVS
jgi:hypothetical protein